MKHLQISLKRLTSYSKEYQLYTTTKEFGKIMKTDFLLNHIDDVELRQRIEKQLNKVESSNKFSTAVFWVEIQNLQLQLKSKTLLIIVKD